MKLCIDCAHFRPSELPDPTFSLAKCGVAYSVNPVCGIRNYRYASEERLFIDGMCQMKAIHFKPKEVSHEQG
jgi:hypothetical protein